MARAVSGEPLGALEELDQDDPREESPEVGPESDAALLRADDAGNAAEELQEGPVEEHRPRRQGDRGDVEPEGQEGEYPHAGEEHQISAHYAADRAGGAHHRHR